MLLFAINAYDDYLWSTSFDLMYEVEAVAGPLDLPQVYFQTTPNE